MTTPTPTVPEAIDLIESWMIDGRYGKSVDGLHASCRIVLDELTRVQAELNDSMRETSLLRERLTEAELKLNRVQAELQKAAGEIVVLREKLKEAVDKTRKCNTCRYPLRPIETVCPCCGDFTPEYQVTQ